MAEAVANPLRAEVQPQPAVAERFRGAWNLYNQATESGDGTNLRGITRIFLRSMFSPDTFPKADLFPPKVDKALLSKLSSPSPYGSAKPEESIMHEAEKTLIHRLLDVAPPIVPQALETIDALAKASHLTIWTVGDYRKSKHQLPAGLVSTGDTLLGTGHQMWKLWKLGLTEKPDVHSLASDDKLKEVIPSIQQKEAQGIRRFVFMDDKFSNLQRLKSLFEDENIKRKLAGETPIQFDLVLVNQGSYRKDPPPNLDIQGNTGTYSVIDRFDQSPSLAKEIAGKTQGQLGVYCDFDGVITNNTAMRAEWDKLAQQTVNEVVERSQLKNPQKAKRGGEKLKKEDLTLESVKDYLELCRKKGLRIGVKNGAYDIVQPGHIGGFDDAKDACDILIVLLNSDESIRRYKGAKENVPRPLVTEIQRADVLLGLENVDGVVIFDENNPSDMIRKLRPNVYISSEEYRGKPLDEFKACEDVGAEIMYTNIREGYSTSSVVRGIIEGFLQTMEAKGLAPEGDAKSAAELLKKLAGYA